MKKLYFLMVLFVLISLRIQGQVVFSESFDDDAFPSGWTAIDADGDNHNWVLESFNPHSGTGHFASASYDNAILFPDNWLISPLIELPAGAELSFWVVAQDSDWVGEHWGVYISTEEEISISDFVSLYQAVSAPSTYEQVTIDLSDYAGQSVRIAFRHYNCSDQFWLNIDDVTISVEQMCNLMIEYYVDPSSQVAEGDWLSVFAGGAYMGGVSSYNYSSTGHDIVTVPVPAGVTLNFEWHEPVQDHNSYFAVFDPMDERMVFVKEYGGTLPDGQAGTYTSTCGASCTAEDKCPLHVSMSRTPGNGYGDYTVFVTLEGMDMGELVLTQEQSSLDTTLYFCPGRLVELYANGGSDFSCVITDDFGKTTELNTDNSYGIFTTSYITNNVCAEQCELILNFGSDLTFSSGYNYDPWLMIYAGESQLPYITYWQSDWYGNMQEDIIPVSANVPLRFVWHDPDPENHSVWFDIYDPADQQLVYSKPTETILDDGQFATYTPTCGTYCNPENQCPVAVSIVRQDGTSGGDYVLNVSGGGLEYGENEYYMELRLPAGESQLDTTLSLCPQRYFEIAPASPWETRTDIICTVEASEGVTEINNTSNWTYNNTYSSYNVCEPSCELFVSMAMDSAVSGDYDWQNSPWLEVFVGNDPWPSQVFLNSQVSQEYYTIRVTAGTTMRFVWHEPDVVYHSSHFFLYDPMNGTEIFVKNAGEILADGQFATYTPTCSSDCAEEEKCPMHVELFREANSTTTDYVVQMNVNGMDPVEMALSPDMTYLDTTLMLCENRNFILWTQTGGSDFSATITDAHGNVNTSGYYPYMNTSNPCAQHCYISVQIGAAEQLSNIAEPKWLRVYEGDVESSDFWFNYSSWNSSNGYAYISIPVTASNTPWRFVWTEPDPVNFSSFFTIYDDKSGRVLLQKESYTQLPNGLVLEFTPTCEVEPIVAEQVTNITVNSAVTHISVNTIGIENYTSDSDLLCGVCWGTSTNPTLEGDNSSTFDISGIYYGLSVFNEGILMQNLTPNTTYHVRSFVVYNGETIYGNELEFNTLSCTNTEEITATACSEYSVYNNIVVLSEGFEGGALPTGWTCSGSSLWTVGTGDYSTSTGAHSGSYNAKVTHTETNSVKWLYTPQFDLSSMSDAQLTFWYINRSWSGDIDELAVMCRIAGSSDWQSLRNITNNHSSWTKDVITLPENTVQLAFVMTDRYGYGVGLDDITVEAGQSVGTFTETGTYTYTRPNEYGCLDTVILHLTVLNNLPQLHTYNIGNITAESADGWGVIEESCGLPVLESGLCYSTEHNPTIAGNHVVNLEGQGGGDYIYATMTGLNEGTTYYVRAYATNSAGTSYGEEVSFTTLYWAALSGTVTDFTTQAPIAGAYVSVYYQTGSNNPHFVTSVLTDNNGNYTVSGIVSGNYTVTANASGYNMTNMVSTLQGGTNMLSLSLTPEDCQIPVNVDYELLTDNEGNSLKLNWEMAGDTISQETSTVNWGTYGIGNQYSVGVYHLFTPEQLVSYNGGVINSVGAWFSGRYEYTTYTIRIWTGGTEDEGPASGTPAYEQVVSPDGIVLNAWNDIPLNTPFVFDGTQCLWVGFHVDCNAQDVDGTIYSIGITDYNNVTGHYGNVIHWYDGEDWIWYPYSGLYYDWMIRAKVVPNALTYNVYENETAIATGVEGNSYVVSPYVIQNQPCYQVAANCVNGQTSALSACATVMQTLPTVVTDTVESVGTMYATCIGEVIDDGNDTILERGFCWSTIPHPSKLNGYLFVDPEGDFRDTIFGLSPQTTYYVRAFATNSLGTAYGNEKVFTTLEECYAPMDLIVSEVVSGSAYISWHYYSENNSAPEYYELQYKIADAENWTTISNITEEYYMLTGLTQQTSYMVQVHAVCGSNRISEYTNSVSFNTPCLNVSAETVIGTPDATTSTSGGVLPTQIFYKYSYTQQIYTAAEIGGAKTIDKLAMQYFYSTANTRNIAIYMGHTDKTAFSGSYDWVPNSDLTLVYSGYITFNNQGDNYWVEMPLTTPFEYNGTGNLVIAFDDNTGSYTQSGEKFLTHSTSESRSIYVYNDGTNYSPSNLSSYSGTLLSYRNNIRIPGSCETTGCEMANVAVRDVTDSSASLLFVSGTGADGIVIEYKKADSENYNVLAISESPYTLTGLQQNTAYDVRVCSVCGNDTSAWKSTSFTTGVKYVERLYVKSDGTGEGASWEEATNDVAWALSTAEAVYQTYGYMPEIWVAEGVYHGNTTASIAFAYTKGTKLYGGFAGNETELSQRDYINHVTVLDGQNTRQVLASQSPTSYSSVNTIIDGFTIRNGYTTSAYGGGVYINNGNTYLRNCVITNNYAYHGGGVYAAGGSSNYIVYIDRCTITDNTTMNYGGGVYGFYAKISNSSITNNVSTASYGYGGGIYNGNMDTIINCLIAGNSSYYGAGIYFNNSNKTVINSTIVNNYAPGSYGYYAGVYNSANFVNSVIWGNKVNGTASNLTSGSSYNFQTSAVEGDMSGYAGVISLQSENLGDGSGLFYPAFVSPETGDYRLQNQSALIDAGTSDVPVDSLDLAGTARFYGDAIDIGCYESHGEVYCIKPYNLAVQDMTGSSAMLIWQNGTQEEPDHYELSYKAENEDSWTVVAEELHGLYYMLNGLSPQTNYSVRVRSFCGGLAGTSPYSDVLNFTTTCADVSPEVSVEGTITTTSRSLPVDFYYNNYFYSQQIYKSSELEGVGTIDHLQIQYYYGTSYTRNVEIYLGHTDQSIYTSGYGWVPGSNLTKVYDGSITFTNTGEDYWLDIPLSQSFAYNGTQNLVVMFYDKTGSYITNSSNKFYVNNSGENNAMYCAGNTLDFDNLSNVYGSITNYRNTLRIPGSCNPNGCPQANITVMDITDSSALVVFSEATGADSYELEYKVAGSANYTSLTAESPYLWTGLRPNTEYVVRIRSLCGDTAQSNWKTASFVTSVKNLNRLYVKTTGTGDASSWQDASNDLAWTMDLALAIKQQFGNTPDVWVAEGTYYGDSVSYNAFTMVDGVNVYGGFVGNEADDYDLSLRDVTAHPTILDGQNFQRVLYQPDNFSNRTLWDGFTLQHGLADYSNNDGYGGAAYLRQNASLRHCQLLNNNAQYGGGAYMYSSYNTASGYHPVLDSCVVMNNTADLGGGVYAYNAQVLNSTISHNTSISSYGGGVYAYYYSCVDHCVITHNEASNSSGGGVYVYSNSSSHLGISNCLIAHNTSYYYGGGVYSSYYSRIYNSTIVNNQSSYSGAGLYFNNSSSYNRMSNCVVWGNSVNGTVANFNISPTFSHVAVEGGVEGNDEVIALQSTNFGTDSHLNYPFFVSPGSDDYRLRAGSALINAGMALENMPTTDLAGGARVYGDTVDIGCYEFHGEEYCSEPYGLAVEDVTGSSAMVIWNNSNMNEPLYYELSYKTADAAEWTVVDQLHVNYYMLNGLQAQTSYMVRVRVACDSEQSSDYTNVVSFSTNCSGDYATELTIGTSTSTDYSSIPFYADYPYSYSQQIFSAEEMGDARTIDTIYLQYFYDSGLSRNISIYLGHTNKSYFEGTSRSDIVTSGFEKVYDGEFSFNNSGDNYWIAIPLQTPFEYNGNDNLVIAFKDSTGNSSDWYTRFYGTYANTNTTVYYYGYYNLDYDHLNNYSGSSNTSWRNNIRFPAKCSEGCDRANLVVTELTDSSALIHFVAGSGSTGYEMAYCESGSNTYITLTPGSSPYLLTGLTQNTVYNIRIRSLCSADESRWVTRVFHTMPKNLDHLYVSTTGNGDASSWSEASSDLVWTMNTAARIKEEFGTNPVVWVAQGTYYGDSTSANAFTMVEGVNVYGGFEGDEAADYDLSLRDFTSHATILDGQYNQRVLCQNDNFDTQTVWDGFTMQHGNALSNNNNGDGGAAYLKANVILSNCNIVNNTAYSDGGGVYIMADYNRPTVLDHCNISHNTATYDNGGGVNASYGILRYCTVSYNYAYDYGGGVYVYNASNANSYGNAISNCLIANNTSRYNGGGVYNRSSNTVIANSTIVNNASTNSNNPGAGVYGSNSANLRNSILWGNKNYGSVSNLAGTYNCQYCATEEVVSGTGNISLVSGNDESVYFSPHFVNPSLVVGYTDNTDNVDWHLSAASVCVNRGGNSLVAAADSLDLDGNARIQVQTVDMGCYESSYDGIILPEYGDIVYVKQGGSGSMDGTSWTNALASVSEALSIAAMYNADVWIAAGTYYGDSISNSAFTMVEGVNVYGGFAGNEPENYNLSLRDFTAHATILDGQNNQRVLYQPNGFSNQHTTWDGFTIQNGNVESNNNSGYGGGAYLRGGVTLNHCIVTNNYSYYNGGGVYGESNNTNDSTYLLNSSVTYNTARYYGGGGAYFSSKCVADNCLFAYNTASSGYDAGGVYNSYSIIRNSTISHNMASSGAGVYNYYGSVSSSVITHNTASGNGGGLYLSNNNNNAVSVSNCLVANNTSSNSGAGVYGSGNNTVRSSSIVNNKITGTSSSYQGAGAYSNSGTLTIANSIVWGNQKNGETSGIAGTHVANYVASDDACTGEYNVALMSSAEAMFSPKFVHPSAEAGAADTTSNVDWHLQQGSPCVNRGDNSLAATFDLAGAARIQQDTIDLGCYESPYNSVVLPVYDDIIYVVEGGAGAMTGENWNNAMASLQDAVQIAAMNNAVVWVAAGTYQGDGTSENAFVMKPGVSVYGGFAGNEAPDYDLSQRDFTTNATVLDGQFSQRVLMQPSHFAANTAVVWDGFSIQNGKVNGDGAGVYMRAYSTLRNCKVQYNIIGSASYSSTSRYGAGVYAYGNNSSQRATISNCKISYNGFENMYNGYAGGIYSYFANVDHTEISHNTATNNAGGAYLNNYSDYSNCLIFANTAQSYGGGVYLYYSYNSLINCDIVNNTASSYGGGVYYGYYSNQTLTNCIVWGNKKGYVVNNFGSTSMSNVTYCAVEDGYNGTGNIALASSNDGNDGTLYYVRFNDPQNEDYQLHPTSSCVNVGDASVVTDSLDFYGNLRVLGESVDMGCSEVQEESSCTSVINLTASNITTNSAQLSWQPTGEESQWVVMYGMVNGSESTNMTVTETSCTLQNLEFNRNYWAKVRAVCDENMMSIFSIPVNFQTTCDPTVLDTLPNFSNMNPANDEIIYNSHVNFSWATMLNATSYDFYLWKSTESEPSTPSRSGLTQPIVSNYTVPGYGPGVTYYWKVVAWNECVSKTSPVMTLQTNKVPDLHVTNVVCSNASLGQSVTVEWTVKNDGEGNTTPGLMWTDYIWLVHDADVRYYDSHDRKLLEIGSLQALNAGESYTNSANVTIPTDIEPGNYFLFVFADQPDAYNPDFSHCPGGVAPVPYEPSVTGVPYPYVTGSVHFEGVIDEVQNHDNFFYILLTILPPPSPDLVVSAITHSTDALSGHEANVSWTVTNQGEAAAMGSWTDAVYLSSDTILDTENDLRVGRFVHQGPLVINESYQMSEQFTIPVNYSGNYYFIIVTDNNNTVYEGLEEMNNKTVSDAMPVTMSWLTDLQVDSVMMSDDVVDANGQYNCSFVVSNVGASPTNVNGWNDVIYISDNPTLNIDNATRLASVRHSGILSAQNLMNPETSMYRVSVNIRIPENITGNWYLHVVTDVDNEVFEYEADDNNVYTYQPALTVLNPDLTVTRIALPDVIDPNVPARIQWTVLNEGPGNAVSRSFTDKFFFNGNLLYTASVHNVNISAGDSIVRYATVQIPCVVASSAELTITTDANTQVLESNENNNSMNVNLSISTPDLVVSGVTPIISSNNTNDALWSGTSAELSYTVTNSGDLAVVGARMTDKVYLSASATSYQASDLVYTNVHPVNLAVDESDTYLCTVTIPNGISGNYYYHVVINTNDSICEGANAGVNEDASEAVEVMLSPSPDLVITEVTAPSQVYIGAGFQLTYTIQNQGTAAINQSVVQKFYYSTSPTAYDTLKLMATINDYLSLAVNGSVTNVVNVTMPININAGNYYIHMVTDANNQVYEYNGENNNHNHSASVIASTYQLDLQLTQIEGPDVMQWGQTATFTLHIRNNTNLPTLASTWQDVIYLSNDDVLHTTDRLMQSVNHSDVLEGGAEYEVDIQVTIPYGTASSAYLIAVADFNSNNPDININNNILTKALTINSVPTPDLAVSELSVLDDVYAGQPARLAYKVTNVGEVSITQQNWNDKMFVSYNNTYENIDVQLLSKERRNMTLAPNEFYTDTLTFTVPLPYNGDLYLLMMANAANNPYETVQDNNTAAVAVNVILPLPGDLVVTEVSCERTVVSGQMLHATWTIQNIGDNALAGRGLRSLVYVSVDTAFDANDRLLGSVTTDYINLPIDATMQQSLAGRISGLAEGSYFLIVKTDVTNAFNEVSDNNNTGCSSHPFLVTIRPLPFNTDVYDTVTNNVVSDYMLNVGDQVNQTVRVHINSEDSAMGAVNMIYATYNNMGSNLNYSYSTIGQYTANSELYIPATLPGYYGVNIYGSTPTNQPQNLIVRADILPFELMGVHDNHGGNTGVTTVELTGSRFRPDMTVCLRNGNEVICADTLIYVNYYQAFAQFDLTGRTPGVYDVSAVNFCEGEAVLSNAFTIENGQPSGLSYNLLFPSSPRPNRNVVLMLEYGNTGNVDLHDQVLEITSTCGSPIALTTDELSQHRTTLRIPLSIEGEPAGLLRPGSYGTINIYCYSSGALIFTIKPVEE